MALENFASLLDHDDSGGRLSQVFDVFRCSRGRAANNSFALKRYTIVLGELLLQLRLIFIEDAAMLVDVRHQFSKYSVAPLVVPLLTCVAWQSPYVRCLADVVCVLECPCVLALDPPPDQIVIRDCFPVSADLLHVISVSRGKREGPKVVWIVKFELG